MFSFFGLLRSRQEAPAFRRWDEYHHQTFDQFMRHGFRDPAYIEHLLLRDKTYGAQLLPLYHSHLNELIQADKIS